jgi:uncharacterized protein with GYD domain
MLPLWVYDWLVAALANAGSGGAALMFFLLNNCGRLKMPLYMYQAAYTAESLAAQLKNPQDRVEAVGRAACEAVGGKLVGGWYCFGDFDLTIIADVPNNESMTAISLAIAAGGAIKSAKTTVLMTGAEAVAGMKKAGAVAKGYKPAR